MAREAARHTWRGRSTPAALTVVHRILGVAILVMGCTMSTSQTTDGDGVAGSGGSDAGGSPTAGAGSDRPVDASPQVITFQALQSDASRLVGELVEVTGKVFFLADCPPPGDSRTTCVLSGYLAAPDRGVLIASDVPQALVLAEGGNRLSCEEGTQSPPACGDWQAATRYTVVGVLQNQVLGGRETSLVQLNVLSKTPLP